MYWFTGWVNLFVCLYGDASYLLTLCVCESHGLMNTMELCLIYSPRKKVLMKINCLLIDFIKIF